MDEPEATAELVGRFRDRGFRAFKIGWGPFGRRDSYALDEAIVRAAREAAGEASRLFVDAGASDGFWPNGLKWARRTADMLAEYNVGWFEEPLRPDAIDDYRELRRASRVPIAGGEVLTRRQTFVPWLTSGALDIVQPDITKVGGISEQRRIAWLADDFGVKLVGHGWNTALGVAADLQVAAALPSTELVEFIGHSRGAFRPRRTRMAADSGSARIGRHLGSRQARPLHGRPVTAVCSQLIGRATEREARRRRWQDGGAGDGGWRGRERVA
jgi:L-alanine-DL-glutamate epimerase-like enolase superfamily enzyme